MSVLEKRYTEDHEWVELSTDGKIGLPNVSSRRENTDCLEGTIGISEYAAKALGDVVYVELPTVDTEVDAGNAIGAVESVKSASDIMSPVSGTVREINSALEDKASLINQSPEAEAWLARIEIKDAAEVESLMDAQRYKKFTEEADESH